MPARLLSVHQDPQAAPVEGPPTAACLASTALIDSAHPAVVAFARQHAVGATTRERAVALTLAVRDGFRYDPYRIDLSPAGVSASQVLAIGVGWCVTKAALLAAACRAAGIPARVGYADVRNHLSTERMRQQMQTDLFVWHGYTDIWIDDDDQGGAWRKATPAFNIELCDRFGLLPLDFDGRADSLYHPYDRSGQRHMEYVRQHGSFDDMPLARITADFHASYPGWIAPSAADSFAADVAREVLKDAPSAAVPAGNQGG
jgi:transglutaminase-like putative cysteine protease